MYVKSTIFKLILYGLYVKIINIKFIQKIYVLYPKKYLIYLTADYINELNTKNKRHLTTLFIRT